MKIPSTYTVESVTNGHPDKVCDQISDAILDACLKQDPASRVAVETFGAHGHLIIGGEVSTRATVDYAQIARDVYAAIGYTDTLQIAVHVVHQSPDIAQGVDTGGAGDQGIMYGFACDETESLLPRDVVRVHKLASELEHLRLTQKELSWIKPDGKSQITVFEGSVASVLVSTQHSPDVDNETIRMALTEHLIKPVMGGDIPNEIYINPTGAFVVGGFTADTGLTGRKIMVDSYCGLVPHGGGAFSGKDPTKVDRSAAYMARFAAKNIVAHKLAKSCLVSVAYAIGKEDPLMLTAENENCESLTTILKHHFDFRPKAIIERLNLRRPIYQQTAAYGHFGKPGLPWEEVLQSLT